jgi:predicted enzyme related to lactoylglutathione lyase
MNSLLINIDVSDIQIATNFYMKAFDLKEGRRLDEDVVELLGFPSPIFLLEKKEGTAPFEGAPHPRSFKRHWTPVHLDIVVESIEEAVERTKAAGGIFESGIHSAPWGKIALFSDPFGNGLCLIQFIGRGYDEIAQSTDRC